MRVISLFSGAGGLDLGLIQAGHTVLWANELDKDAAATYRLNIGPHIVEGDIGEIGLDTMPEADVVVGGFPCEGFSRANLRRSLEDTRNNLYVYFVRTVRTKQPLYFLAENVRGLLTLAGGAAIRRIVRDFGESGYRVQYQLFNTADYGVPQTRQRVIIAGTRNDLPPDLDYIFPQPTHSRDAQPDQSAVLLQDALLPWATCWEALKDVPEPDAADCSLANHVYSRYKVTNRDFTGHRWTDPSKPSPTVLARGDGGGGVCALQHPLNHRRMSVRETAIIQTFPTDFGFVGSMNSCYRQVGNAVPVLFAKRLGEQLAVLEERLETCA